MGIQAMGRSVALAVAMATFTLGMGAGSEERFSEYVEEDGSIRLPDEFRTELVHMGSWFVPSGDASGFHDVYTQKGTIEAFRETGAFPDGAVLVKEIRSHDSGDYTTGANVGRATGVKQWFVMIKDRKGRFPDHPLWGEGWGWALYKPDDRAKNVATSYEKDCLGCHAPAMQKDWVYTEGYPTLEE